MGKFGASISFFIVYLYTAELFPTTVRNQAVGICSLVARIGGITALLLDLTKVFWLPAPVFIMGVIATVVSDEHTLDKKEVITTSSRRAALPPSFLRRWVRGFLKTWRMLSTLELTTQGGSAPVSVSRQR